MAFDGHIALDGVDLELRRGEVVLLRGENGSGKTTLLNILTGNLQPDAGVIQYLTDETPRTYKFPRPWWRQLNPFDHFTPEFVAREGIARTWQDVRLFKSQPLRDNITVARFNQPGENPLIALLSPKSSTRREAEINREADAMLARLGLIGRETSSADKISLGQSKRVAMIRAVAAGAKILFLDEPLAGLDRKGINDVVSLIADLITRGDTTFVIIEHAFNQAYLHHLATTDWLLEDGSLKVNATSARQQRSEPATPVRHLERPAWLSALIAPEAVVMDQALPRDAFLTQVRIPDVFQIPQSPVLEIKDLIVKRGSRTVIGLDETDLQQGLTLRLHRGELGVLQAPNGWGKSTLLAAIAGLIPIEQGSILIDGNDLAALPPWERVRSGLSVLLADQMGFSGVTVGELLTLTGKAPPAADFARLGHRLVSSLSGGERQRLMLSTVRPGRVRIFDEPFFALDAPNTQASAVFTLPTKDSASLILIPRRA